MHADTFNGESPFEVVAWLPLVDCYKTKVCTLLIQIQAIKLPKS